MNYLEAFKMAEAKADKESKLMWPPRKLCERIAEKARLTHRYFMEYTVG